MIKSFTKFTLFSYVLTTWVLPVPALHLEPRGGICNGLTQTRPISGIRACTNPNNVFKYPHLHRTPAALTGVRGAASPSGFVCDHALELTLVNNALNADLCVPLLADQRKPTAAQKIAVLKPIIDIANNADNNLFLVTTAVENFKTSLFRAFLVDNPLRITSHNLDLAQAGQDYLTKTQLRSIATANAIDAAIEAAITQNGYPVRSGSTVSAGWTDFLTKYSSAVSNFVADTGPSAAKTTSEKTPEAAAPAPVSPQLALPQPAPPEPVSPELAPPQSPEPVSPELVFPQPAPPQPGPSEPVSR